MQQHAVKGGHKRIPHSKVMRVDWAAVQLRIVASTLRLREGAGAGAAEQQTFDSPCGGKCACAVCVNTQELALHYDLHPLALEDTGGVRVEGEKVFKGVRDPQQASTAWCSCGRGWQLKSGWG